MTKRGRPPYEDTFTPAEWRILHATRHGMSNQNMAERMGVSINAIKYHLRNILEKANLSNKKALRTFTQQPKNLFFTQENNQGKQMTQTNELGAIGQISRTVKDIEISRNWYELVLELPHLYTFGTLSFFDCDGTRLMLNQNETFNPSESILYFRVSDIIVAHQQLQQKGVEFVAAPHKIHQHDDGSEEWMAFFKDPDDRPLALMSKTSAKQ